jgi:hypothetical protein
LCISKFNFPGAELFYFTDATLKKKKTISLFYLFLVVLFLPFVLFEKPETAAQETRSSPAKPLVQATAVLCFPIKAVPSVFAFRFAPSAIAELRSFSFVVFFCRSLLLLLLLSLPFASSSSSDLLHRSLLICSTSLCSSLPPLQRARLQVN